MSIRLWEDRRWLRDDASGENVAEGVGPAFQVTHVPDSPNGVAIGCYRDGRQVFATSEWMKRGSVSVDKGPAEQADVTPPLPVKMERMCGGITPPDGG